MRQKEPAVDNEMAGRQAVSSKSREQREPSASVKKKPAVDHEMAGMSVLIIRSQLHQISMSQL